jgi:hypothetical protein
VASENRWPNMFELQDFIDWLKTVPEEQLRLWVADAFCKGDILDKSDLLKHFLMYRYNIKTSMVGKPPPIKPDEKVVYTRHD